LATVIGRQWENRIGSGGFDSRRLVAPPRTNSRHRANAAFRPGFYSEGLIAWINQATLDPLQ